MRRYVAILILGAVAALVGCYKNDIMHTYHPEHGLVLLFVDPPELEEGDTMPTEYVIEVNGVRGEVVDGRITFARLVDPGTYDIRIYNETDAIKVDAEGVAHSAVNGEKTALSDSHIYFGEGVMTISKDYNDKIEIHIERMTRKLTFQFAITEGDVDKVDSVYMSFSGVASGLNCRTGERVGTACVVESSFEIAQSTTKGVTSDDGYYLTSSLHLLGTMGVQQRLEVEITYKNGNRQHISSNLDGQFADFNSGDTTTKIMQTETKLLSETQQSATIVDWAEAEEGFDFEIGPGESLK